MTIPHYSKEAAVLEVNLFLQSGLDQLTTRVRFCVRFCTTVRRGVLYETIIFAHKNSSDVALFKAGENTGNNDQNLGVLKAVQIFLIPFFFFLACQASRDKSRFEEECCYFFFS